NGTEPIEGGGAFTIAGDTLKVKLTQMTANQTYTAQFVRAGSKIRSSKLKYTVRFSPTVGGRVSLSSYYTNEGNEVVSTALPDPGCMFVGWFDSAGQAVLTTSSSEDVYVAGRSLHVTVSSSVDNKPFIAKFARAVLDEPDGKTIPRIVVVGEGDDAKLMLSKNRKTRGDLFQFGSVMAWDIRKVQGGGYKVGSVKFNPSDLVIKEWTKSWKVGTSFPDNTAENIKAGKGDPCRLVGFTVAQIKALTAAGRPVDNYSWRLPTMEENKEFIKKHSSFFWYKQLNGIYFGPDATKNGTGGEFVCTEENKIYSIYGQGTINTDCSRFWSRSFYRGGTGSSLHVASSKILGPDIRADIESYFYETLPIRCVQQ
ncbi:MAG: InlB B-repeat-containing protein, partial [Phocaeicola sp.]